jgi:hypothetical protein
MPNASGHVSGHGVLAGLVHWKARLAGRGTLTGTVQFRVSRVYVSGHGALTATVSTGSELVFFPVTGFWLDVENPALAGDTNALVVNTVSGDVTFYPRLPNGFVAYVENLDLQSSPEMSGPTAVAIPSIEASIVDGVLVSNVVGDTPGIQLLSNSANLQLASQGVASLYYDVQYSNVMFAGVDQLLMNWAFIASTDSTAVCLTDPNLVRYAYGGPL